MTEIQTIDGRSLKPLLQKLNPIWWFENDDEQHVSDAPWYHPEWPQWRREFYWNFLRNPLQNFRCYVLGVADRNYTVAGRTPVMTVQRDDRDQARESPAALRVLRRPQDRLVSRLATKRHLRGRIRHQAMTSRAPMLRQDTRPAVKRRTPDITGIPQ
jgi:hypothetical protein